MSASVAFVLVLSVLPSQQGSQSDDVAVSVARLVQQLEADEFAIRRAAREALLKFGPKILPLLATPTNATANLKGELDSVRRALRDQRAVGTLKPKLVTLNGKLTVDQIVDRVRKQSGNSLSVAQLSPQTRGRELDVSYSKTPFWQVVNDLSERLKVGFKVRDGGVQFESQTPLARSSLHELFLTTLAKPQSKPLQGRTDNLLLRLPLTCAPEPRVRALFAKAIESAVIVKSGSGNVLDNYSQGQSLELPFAGRGERVAWTHDVVLPKGVAADQLDIQGELSVLMATAYEKFEFKDLRPQLHPRIRRTGVDLRLEDVDENESRGEVSITITVGWNRSVSVFDSYRTWQFHNEAWLKTSEGKRLNFKAPLSIDRHVGGAVLLTYRFVGLEEPVRFCSFVYEAPSSLQTVRVPFRFSATE